MLGVATHPHTKGNGLLQTLPRPGSGLQTLPGTGHLLAPHAGDPDPRVFTAAVARWRALERLRDFRSRLYGCLTLRADALSELADAAVFAAAAGEVLPDLNHQGHLPAVVIGFVIGVAVLLPLQRMEQRAVAARAADGKAGLPAGMLAAVGVDLLIDGMLVGLGATLSSRQGIILAAALTLEIGFLALAVTAELAGSTSRARAAVVSAALALACARGGADRRAGPGPRTRRDPGGGPGRGDRRAAVPGHRGTHHRGP
jgi:hypothetical protein